MNQRRLASRLACEVRITAVGHSRRARKSWSFPHADTRRGENHQSGLSYWLLGSSHGTGSDYLCQGQYVRLQQCPKQVVFVDALATNPSTGKILWRSLQEAGMG